MKMNCMAHSTLSSASLFTHVHCCFNSAEWCRWLRSVCCRRIRPNMFYLLRVCSLQLAGAIFNTRITSDGKKSLSHLMHSGKWKYFSQSVSIIAASIFHRQITINFYALRNDDSQTSNPINDYSSRRHILSVRRGANLQCLTIFERVENCVRFGC